MKKVLLFSVLLLLVASAIWTGVFLYQKSNEPKAIFSTTQPFIANIARKTVATGKVVPRKEIDLKPQVSGVVEAIFVEAGDTIKRGEQIAKIELIPNVQSLNSAKSQLETAKISLRNAEREKARQEKLFKEGLIPESEYNRFLLDYELQTENVIAAENAIALIQKGASARVGKASNIVSATIEGMVIDVPVKEGAFVTETNTFNDGTTIATLANMNDIIFEGLVDEAEVGKLEVGMPLEITVGAIDNEFFKARLEFISPKGSEDQGSIKFEIRAAVTLDREQFLRAGYSANADIVLETRDQVLAINEAQLIIDGGQTFVEVEVGEQVFERRPIEVGLSDGINIEVVSGLKERDRIKVF